MLKQGSLVHVLGAGHWQLPSIARAKELGLRVVVTDRADTRPGYAVADAHEIADISDPDATLTVARRHQVDAIVCDTTDAGVFTAAKVAEEMGLPGIGSDVARRFTDKVLMRQVCEAAGLPQPGFRRVTTLEELREAATDLGFPLVIKPLDRMAGVGVRHLSDEHELERAFRGASDQSLVGAAIVEQKLRGTECTVDGYVVEGRSFVLALSDKEHFEDPPTVAKRICFPGAFSNPVRAEIERVHQAVITALGMTHGVTHAEYFVDGNDVTLVEIAARGGGSQIFTHVVPALAGVDLVTANLRFSLGAAFEVSEPGPASAAVHLEFIPFGPGRVTRIDGLEEARRVDGLVSLFFDVALGAEIPRIENDRHRKVHVIAEGETRQDAARVVERVRDILRVTCA